MKITAHAIALFLVTSLHSCDNALKLQEATQPPPIDSFTTGDIDAEQQTGNFRYTNDSMLHKHRLFMIPGKGLAMLLPDEYDETSRFYMYNL